jgi:hypothetical protein
MAHDGDGGYKGNPFADASVLKNADTMIKGGLVFKAPANRAG